MVHHFSSLNETEVSCHNQSLINANNVHTNVTSALIDEISHIHYHLGQVNCLKPSEHINALFTKLVTICTFQYDDMTVFSVLNDTRIAALIPSLRKMASQGEHCLELTWATDLVEQAKEYPHRKPNLSQFVYFQNYQDLVKLEIHALLGAGAKLNNIVFIGSGPLPLSSILMYQHLPSATMHNIDRDQDSIYIAGKLIEKLGISKGFQQYVMNATDYQQFDQADVVILAALVGENVSEKMEFLKQIGRKMKSGSFLMARSAHSLRKLLYPSIEPHQVNTCEFETVLVLHPYNDIVNSVLIAKKL